MRRVETIQRQFEEKVSFLVCDICKEEIGAEVSMSEDSGYRRSGAWWRYPLDWIVSIKEGSIRSDYYNSDYDVHVLCAYKAIREKVESK